MEMIREVVLGNSIFLSSELAHFKKNMDSLLPSKSNAIMERINDDLLSCGMHGTVHNVQQQSFKVFSLLSYVL